MITQPIKWHEGKPSVVTIIRWFNFGYDGIILKSWRFGNFRVASIEALDEFFAQTQHTRHHSSKAAAQAGAKLDTAGVTSRKTKRARVPRSVAQSERRDSY